MRLTLLLSIAITAAVALPAGMPGANAAERMDTWPAYLDYAYVYVSAQPRALAERLGEYGRQAGVNLEDFVKESFDVPESVGHELGEDDKRRQAIAHLLLYVATSDAAEIEAAVEAIGELSDRLERRENRWWHHYILAHHALHHGHAAEFSTQVFDLWLNVVAVMETSFQTHQALSLHDRSGAGFTSALPYLYENLARLVLLRSQETGLDHGLDPLGVVVRMLHEGRVGAHPSIVPPEASSAELLEHIVSRLDGPESDAGSLTFTLALFEAARQHDRARTLLASEGLTQETQESIRVTAGAYRDALRRADTLQGQNVVYTRALRQLGELYAAKERLGVDPDVDVPFSIERAMKLYDAMHAGLERDWEDHGYREAGRKVYLGALHDLWEEIQEASFNAAGYYLARGRALERDGNEHVSDAASHYGRYLTFFSRYATPAGREGVPASAYFAAYVAARGAGDAVLSYDAGNPSTAQIELATDRYQTAAALFPFDRSLWSRIARSLERQGRENDFLEVTRPIADAVERSRHLNAWIEQGHKLASSLAPFRRALSDDLVIMHLGFAQGRGVDELESELGGLMADRDRMDQEHTALVARRDALDTERAISLGAASIDEELPIVSAVGPEALPNDIAELSRRILLLDEQREQLDVQIEARSRALPLFHEVLESTDLSRELAGQRDHPAHKLLRQLYFDNLGLNDGRMP